MLPMMWAGLGSELGSHSAFGSVMAKIGSAMLSVLFPTRSCQIGVQVDSGIGGLAFIGSNLCAGFQGLFSKAKGNMNTLPGAKRI